MLKLAGQQLQRKLGLFAVTNIVVSNIIGAGIFTTTGFLMVFLGNPVVMLLLWVAGGVLAFCGALAYGELGASFPEAGGEYLFISKLFHPLLGFLSGWMSLIVGFSAPIAASAIGFGKYLIQAFPDLQSWLWLDGVISAPLFVKLLAIGVIVAFSMVHARGVVPGSRVQNVLSILKVLMICGLITAGLTMGKGSFQNVVSSEPFRCDFNGWKSIGLSLMFIMFAYSGWNASTYIGSEIRKPQRVIPRSLLMATGLVAVLYLLLNLFFVFAIPPDQMAGKPEIAGEAVGFAFGGSARAIVSLLVSFALFSSLSAFIILGPRVCYSMARDGCFFRSVARVHAPSNVPRNALFLQSVIAICMVWLGTFEQILIYMGFSLGIFPLLAVAGVFKLRALRRSRIKMPGYPWVHLVFIFSGVIMLILACLERPWPSAIAVLTVFSGVPVFYWFKRKRV